MVYLERNRGMNLLLKKSFYGEGSKGPGFEAPEGLRSEAYWVVRRHDEGRGGTKGVGFFQSPFNPRTEFPEPGEALWTS